MRLLIVLLFVGVLRALTLDNRWKSWKAVSIIVVVLFSFSFFSKVKECAKKQFLQV